MSHEHLTCEAVRHGEMVEGYIFDRLSAAEAEQFEAHYLTCHRCQSEIREALRLRAALQAADASASAQASVSDLATTRTQRRRGWHPAWKAASLLAAAVLAGLLLLRPSGFSPTDDPAHRAADVGERIVRPLTPDGPVARVDSFSWALFPTAERYRVTVFDEGGTVLFEETTADSVFLAPADLQWAPGATYLWKVEAEVGFDRWLSSELVSFSISEE